MTATHDTAAEGGLSRRSVLGRGAAGLGIALTGSLNGLFGTTGAAHGAARAAGYGPLIADPKGLLALPEGFTYTIVAQSGVTELESGEPTPGDPDGTAAFVRQGGNGSVLINNHEISGSDPNQVPRVPGFIYDPAVGGGTTNIEVDKDGNRVREYVSLAGTLNNCAGGKTPWETWLTCEEAETAPSAPVQHGYVFEVDPYDQERNRDPKPIKAFGRARRGAHLLRAHLGRQRRPARRPGLVPGPGRGHDRAQAVLPVHAGRPGLRPGRPGQHHRLGPRRPDHRRGRRGRLAPGRLDRLFANIQSPGYVFAIQGPWRKQR